MILESIKNKETETTAFLQFKQKGKGFVNLEEAISRVCEITPWAKDGPCKINRAGISSILAKDVANLSKDDLNTMLAL